LFFVGCGSGISSKFEKLESFAYARSACRRVRLLGVVLCWQCNRCSGDMSSMKRKRRWEKEYRCGLFATNIIFRLSFCKEPGADKKCKGCKYRGNEDKLNEEINLDKFVAHVCEQQEE